MRLQITLTVVQDFEIAVRIVSIVRLSYPSSISILRLSFVTLGLSQTPFIPIPPPLFLSPPILNWVVAQQYCSHFMRKSIPLHALIPFLMHISLFLWFKHEPSTLSFEGCLGSILEVKQTHPCDKRHSHIFQVE